MLISIFGRAAALSSRLHAVGQGLNCMWSTNVGIDMDPTSFEIFKSSLWRAMFSVVPFAGGRFLCETVGQRGFAHVKFRVHHCLQENSRRSENNGDQRQAERAQRTSSCFALSSNVAPTAKNTASTAGPGVTSIAPRSKLLDCAGTSMKKNPCCRAKAAASPTLRQFLVRACKSNKKPAQTMLDICITARTLLCRVWQPAQQAPHLTLQSMIKWAGRRRRQVTRQAVPTGGWVARQRSCLRGRQLGTGVASLVDDADDEAWNGRLNSGLHNRNVDRSDLCPSFFVVLLEHEH